ncbi:hypothetical protein [Hydrogenophaga sp. BPS33]|uniref:hypothetical protein n=1 Tax=Hydrogenophaga sp. BPS33 TaxID=2651974 RepID=UPI00131F89EA|nr:hypothetical protein [Hydrogenophaga sp. BPS33]QHE87488.1 hypothetical protein F9K07_22610 [Hydrogenophaga sp. BPS33]
MNCMAGFLHGCARCRAVPRRGFYITSVWMFLLGVALLALQTKFVVLVGIVRTIFVTHTFAHRGLS